MEGSHQSFYATEFKKAWTALRNSDAVAFNSTALDALLNHSRGLYDRLYEKAVEAATEGHDGYVRAMDDVRKRRAYYSDAAMQGMRAMTRQDVAALEHLRADLAVIRREFPDLFALLEQKATRTPGLFWLPIIRTGYGSGGFRPGSAPQRLFLRKRPRAEGNVLPTAASRYRHDAGAYADADAGAGLRVFNIPSSSAAGLRVHSAHKGAFKNVYNDGNDNSDNDGDGMDFTVSEHTAAVDGGRRRKSRRVLCF
jgi:hypothetical protein